MLGCLTAGPLLFPGNPLMFDGSCCEVVEFCWLLDEPTVSPGLTAGPFLFPGWPAIPAPELWALGALEASGLVVWAVAAFVKRANAIASVLAIIFMALSSDHSVVQVSLPQASNSGMWRAFLSVLEFVENRVRGQSLTTWVAYPASQPGQERDNLDQVRQDDCLIID